MFENVVVGADSSPTAAEAVRYAIELAKLSGGTVHIVTAYRPHTMTTKAPAEFAKSINSIDLADALLSELASRAAMAGVSVKTHAESDSPADVICNVAEREHADVIVVGNRGMRGVSRVLGSVPNSVAHNAPCAVLIVNTT